MAMQFDKYSITSIDSIVGFDPKNEECLFILDEIKDATLEGAADIVWATGKQERRLAALKRNKTCKISCNNGFIVGGVLKQQFGDQDSVEDFDNASIEIPAFEKIEVQTGASTVELSFEAVGKTGEEIPFIYKANKDGSQGKAFPIGVQSGTNDSEVFELDADMKTIKLPDGEFDGKDVVIVFYTRLTKGRKYSNKSGNYAGNVKLIADVMIQDICTKAETHSKLVFPSVEVLDNFSYSFGNDMAVQKFEAEAVSSICSGDSEYFYWVFPED